MVSYLNKSRDSLLVQQIPLSHVSLRGRSIPMLLFPFVVNRVFVPGHIIGRNNPNRKVYFAPYAVLIR